MSEIWADIRFALRQYVRQPLLAATVVVALGLGIGVNTGIFSVVNSVLLKPLPYRDPEQLHFLWSRNPSLEQEKLPLSGADFIDIRAQASSFQNLGTLFNYSATITGAGEPLRVYTMMVSTSYFATLGFRPMLGSDFEEKHGIMGSNNVVILGNRFWRRRFGGDPGIVGRGMVLEGELHTIIGVLPDIPEDYRDPDLFVPYAFNAAVMEARNARSLTTLVRLKPGVSVAQAETELRGLAERFAAAHPESNRGLTFFLVPAKTEVTGASRQSLLVLVAAVILVLLITCANLASILLVRAAGRTKEVALRMALGAQSGRIVRQLLTEALTLSLAGGVAGIGLAALTIRAVRAYGPTSIPRLQQTQLDGSALLFALGISLATGLLFGLAPAWQTVRVKLGSTLREESRGTSAGRVRSRARSLLVIAEVAMASLLLVCAGLLVRTLSKLSRVDLGYQSEGVLTLRTTLADPRFPKREDRARYVRRMLDRLRAEPGVRSAAVTVALPMMQVNWMAEFLLPNQAGASTSKRNVATYATVSEDYFATLMVPIRAGRPFNERDTLDSPPVVIISEAFANRYFPGVNPVGKRINYEASKFMLDAEIVGVAGNVKHLDPNEPPRAAIYQPYAQLPWPFLAFAIRTTRDPLALADAVRQAFAEVDSQQPVDRVMPLGRLLNNVLAQRRLAMSLLLVFSALAVVLAALGIYGLLAYSVAQRTQEFGIRIALGADRGSIVRLVLRQGLWLAAAGVFAGLLVAPMAARALAEMLYEVQPWDALTFGLVALLLLSVSALACLAPTLRATRVDPATALRGE